jgi:hypothetical protein
MSDESDFPWRIQRRRRFLMENTMTDATNFGAAIAARKH